MAADEVPLTEVRKPLPSRGRGDHKAAATEGRGKVNAVRRSLQGTLFTVTKPYARHAIGSPRNP